MTTMLGEALDTRESTDELVAEDIDTEMPCEIQNRACGPGSPPPAKWMIVWACCTPPTAACQACLDMRLESDLALECYDCHTVYRPGRHGISYVWSIKK